MSNDLITIYKNILAFAGMSTDSNDMVCVKVDDKTEPVLIDGKRLVLPTQEHLGNAFTTSKVIFHPLNENIIRGESDIVSKLRTSFKVKFNYTTAVLGQTLLKICASIAEHKHLTPEQSEMLSEIKDVDDTTFTTFGKVLIAAMKTNPDKAFVNLFLKSGAKLADRKYSRAGIVSFPLYEELLKGADNAFGVKLRVKDRKAFIQLFEYMYTHVKEPNLYNIGSNSQIAPFLEALLNTSAQLAENLNRVINLFKDKIENADALLFDSDWMDGFDKLEDLLPQIRNIPIQSSSETPSKPAQAPVQQSPVVYPNQMQQPQPMPQQQMPMQSQPMYNQAPQQPMQQPGLVKTENGLDFRSVLRSNQAVAQTVMNNPMSMSTMPMNPMMYPNQMQQMPQQPRWAQPQQPMMQQQYPQQGMMQPNPMYNQQPMQQMPMQMQQPMMQQMPMQMMPQQQMPMMQQPYPNQMMPMQQQMMPQQQYVQQPTFMNR